MLQPLKRNVLIQPDAKEEVTKGGIYVPAPSQHNHKNGVVLATGELVDEVKAGDRVRYGKAATEEEGGLLIVPVENLLWVY